MPLWPSATRRGAPQQNAPQLHNGLSKSKRKAGTSASLILVLLIIGGITFFGCIGFLSFMLSSSSSSTNINRPTNRELFHIDNDGLLPAELAQISAFLEDPTKNLELMDEKLIQTWEYPLVHIVNTRFQQEQGHLKALGMARLHLFRTFCLPTMVHQSTQQFLWIIKTDPELDQHLLQLLIQELQPHSNIYLVASNRNFRIRDHHDPDGNSWRDGAEIRDLIHSKIYTGNKTRLVQAMLQKDRQVVLETRLDADDGLHKYFLQQLQEKALEQFTTSSSSSSSSVPPKWLYWCTRRHVEWHGGVHEKAVVAGQQQQQQYNVTDDTMAVDYFGILQVVEHSNLCITPGITVGFGIGTTSDQVPIHAHDKLFKAIHALPSKDACGYPKASQCLELVEDFLLAAVRARTPTSAGMQRVGANDEDDKDGDGSGGGNQNTTTKHQHQHHKQGPPKIPPMKMYLFWDLLHDDFSVLREQIQYTNKYILNHLIPIARDNLEGQCTSEHSCKNGTKEKLLKIIQESKT